MGQQQILIVILVTVIVAIATIIAIDTMQESHNKANQDAVQQDVLLIINEAQAYYYKSIMQGGGRSFSGIDFSDISIGDSTANGTYSINGSENSLVVEDTGVNNGVFLRADAQFQDGDLQIEWEYE